MQRRLASANSSASNSAPCLLRRRDQRHSARTGRRACYGRRGACANHALGHNEPLGHARQLGVEKGNVKVGVIRRPRTLQTANGRYFTNGTTPEEMLLSFAVIVAATFHTIVY
jgi:hypothetical protein